MACPLLRGIGSAAHTARYQGRGRIAKVPSLSVPHESSFPELSFSSSNFPKANKVFCQRALGNTSGPRAAKTASPVDAKAWHLPRRAGEGSWRLLADLQDRKSVV